MTDRELMQHALFWLRGMHLPATNELAEKISARLAQPEPEPVAWMHDSHVGFNVPLYTAPPQREWQGLTDEDWIIGKRSADYIAGAEWAEAKLKEKNAPDL